MFDGPILPLAIKIGTPILLANIMQFLYALIDTVFISRIDPSSTAILSGTGLMFPLFFLFMAVSMSISIGISSLVGRVIGANNKELSEHIMPSGALISLFICIPALVFGYGFSHDFIHALAGSKLSDEAIGYGQQFFTWLLPGLAVMLFGNMFAGILQGEGLTKPIATAMVLSTILNIILDPIFIFGCNLGVRGAGLATTLSVFASATMMTVSFFREKSSFRFSFNILKARWGVVSEIVRIGFPNFLSMAALAISFIVFNKIVGTIGQTAMNAWALVGRMDQIVLIPSFAVGGATVTMIAQNYGRGRIGRVRRIYNRSILLAMSLVAGAALVYTFSAPFFFRIFSDVNEVVSLAALQVRVVSVTFIGLAVVIVSSSAFQAIGKPAPALFLALIRMGLISVPVALVLVFVMHMQIWGVYIGLGCGNLCALPIAYFWMRRHLVDLERKEGITSLNGGK
jgi:putative MATE family efflux protein